MRITAGSDHTLAYSDGQVFQSNRLASYPVSPDLVRDLKGYQGGDTTGCGDNFVGGVLASLGWQLQMGNALPNLEECLAWGTVSGGYCCFHVGGTMMEKKSGEKLQLIHPYYEKYIKYLHG